MNCWSWKLPFLHTDTLIALVDGVAEAKDCRVWSIRSNPFLPPENEVWGKVMFSQVFFCPQGGSASRGSASGRGDCIQEGGLHLGGGLHPEGGLHLGGLGRTPPTRPPILRDTVNERAVRSLLECILVNQ